MAYRDVTVYIWQSLPTVYRLNFSKTVHVSQHCPLVGGKCRRRLTILTRFKCVGYSWPFSFTVNSVFPVYMFYTWVLQGNVYCPSYTHFPKLVTVDSPFASYLSTCTPRVPVSHHWFPSYYLVPIFLHAEVQASTFVRHPTHHFSLALWWVLSTAFPSLRASSVRLRVLPVTHISLPRYGCVHPSECSNPVATPITAKLRAIDNSEPTRDTNGAAQVEHYLSLWWFNFPICARYQANKHFVMHTRKRKMQYIHRMITSPKFVHQTTRAFTYHIQRPIIAFLSVFVLLGRQKTSWS